MVDQEYYFEHIRELLTSGFDELELRNLCHDLPDFRPVYNRIGRGMAKAQIAAELIDYADKQILVGKLLSIARERNPRRYALHGPYSTDYTALFTQKPNDPKVLDEGVERPTTRAVVWPGSSVKVMSTQMNCTSAIRRKSVSVSLVHRLEGPSDALYVAFSQDGRTLASAGNESVVRLWDTSSGTEVKPLRDRLLGVSSIALSPTGPLLAAGSMNLVILWNVATSRKVRELYIPGETILGLAFSPDGNLLVTAGETVLLWNARNGEQKACLGTYPEAIIDTAFSRDGRYIALAGKGLYILDTEKQEAKYIPGNDRALSVAFAPDGDVVACGWSRDDSEIRLYEAATGNQVLRLEGHPENGVFCLAYSPDGSIIGSGGGDNRLRLWDTTYGRELHCVTDEHSYGVTDIAFSPCETAFASTSSDHIARVWSYE